MTRMPATGQGQGDHRQEPHKGVNPDEVVNVGAAIQAGVLKGEVKDVLLLDVTPLARHRDQGRRLHEADRPQHDHPHEEVRHLPRLPRTTSPRSRSTCSRASRRWRPSIRRSVFQLVGILLAPRGMPQIEVTFDIDANRIINVSAKDLGTGNEQEIRIESGPPLRGGRADDPRGRVPRGRSAQDARGSRCTEPGREPARDKTEKSLKDHRDALDEEIISTIESRTEEPGTALDGTDAAEIRAKSDSLMEASQAGAGRLREGAVRAGRVGLVHQR